MSLSHEKLMIVNRAKRLASLVSNDAPDCIIASDCHLLWEALTRVYGPDIFDKGSDSWSRIHDSLAADDMEN